MLFDLSKITGRDAYKLMTSTVVPRPIALVVSQDADGNNNAAPFSFFNAMSADPPILAIGVASRNSTPKDTASNLVHRPNAQFVVNLVSHAMLEAMNITAVDFPRGVDEIKQAGLTPVASDIVAAPRLAESPVAFECESWKIVPLGNEHYIVLGRVLAMHIDDAAVMDAERCYIDTLKLDLLGRMHHSAYSRQKEVIHLPRIPVSDFMKDRDI